MPTSGEAKLTTLIGGRLTAERRSDHRSPAWVVTASVVTASRAVLPQQGACPRVEPDHLGVAAHLVHVHDQGATDDPLPVQLLTEGPENHLG